MTDLDAVLCELDQYFITAERQPGDIDSAMIAERYGLSRNAARDRMKKMARLPGWEEIEIRENGHSLNVLRRVAPNHL